MRIRHWANKTFSRAEQYALVIWVALSLLLGITAIRAWHHGITDISWAVLTAWMASSYIIAILLQELDRRPFVVGPSTGRHRAEDRLKIGPELKDQVSA